MRIRVENINFGKHHSSSLVLMFLDNFCDAKDEKPKRELVGKYLSKNNVVLKTLSKGHKWNVSHKKVILNI